MGKSISKMNLAAEGILGEFEGTPDTRAGSKIVGATKAMNRTLEVSPMFGHKGDVGFVVFQYEITDISHPNVLGHEDQSRRVHTLYFTDAAIVTEESEIVVKAVEAERTKIALAREAAVGTQRIAEPDGPTIPVGGAKPGPQSEAKPGPANKAAENAAKAVGATKKAVAKRGGTTAKPKPDATVSNIADAVKK